MEFAEVARTRAVQYDEVECRFMSVQTRLQNKTTSYLMFQILLFSLVTLDAFSIQSRFFGASLALSLLATTASFRGLVLDLAEVVEARHRLDLHDNVVTQIHTADLVERTRLVGNRDFRFKVGAGIAFAAVTVFAALMLAACWSLVPNAVVLKGAVGSGINGPGLGFCSDPSSGFNVTLPGGRNWAGPDLFNTGGLAAPVGACVHSPPEAFGFENSCSTFS